MTLRYRDRETAERLSERIEDLIPDGPVKIIHVCGSHEGAVARYGLRNLLPENLDLVMGPGCPVCVTPAEDVDLAVALVEDGRTVATYGDMFRVPGTEKSLAEADGDVRKLHGPGDVESLPEGSVFFAPGFETTAVTHAAALTDWPEDVHFLSSGRLIPPAMELLWGMGDLEFDGFLAPGHVASVIGLEPFEPFEESYSVPVVAGGFEPLDVLAAVLMLVEQVADGRSEVENAYPRAVDEEGNPAARRLMDETFDVETARWRGIGPVPRSGLRLSDDYEHIDARRLDADTPEPRDLHSGCRCNLVLTAKETPESCELFGEACTPADPRGPCMVSKEGMCRIWLRHGGPP